MPYIKQERRTAVRFRLHEDAENAGELNYQLTDVVLQYLYSHGLRYQIINDIIGALESAKAEFQRRIVAPYEDQKLKENGDVYPDK
jgi:hypothetical protein